MYDVPRKWLRFTTHLYVRFLQIFNLRYICHILVLGYAIRGIYTFKTVKTDNKIYGVTKI